MPNLIQYKDKKPVIDKNAWLADDVNVIGDIIVSEFSSIWFGCTLRADVNYIRVGKYSNIQDGSIVHVNEEPSHPTIIGDYVTVGHRAVLHGCTLDDSCLIGMGAIILNGAHVESEAIVAAGALVKEGQTVPSGMLVAGVPAKVIRPISEKEKKMFKKQALHYWNDVALTYQKAAE